jgi:hypothetical protein
MNFFIGNLMARCDDARPFLGPDAGSDAHGARDALINPPYMNINDMWPYTVHISFYSYGILFLGAKS